MARLTLTRIDGFHDLAEFLGERETRKLGHNTTIYRNGDAIAVRYHYTDVITVTPDNVAVINSGGWRTVTTKQRINSLIGRTFFVSQHKYRWTLNSRAGESQPFEDGTRVNLITGDIVGTGGYRPFTVPTIADPKLAAAVA